MVVQPAEDHISQKGMIITDDVMRSTNSQPGTIYNVWLHVHFVFQAVLFQLGELKERSKSVQITKDPYGPLSKDSLLISLVTKNQVETKNRMKRRYYDDDANFIEQPQLQVILWPTKTRRRY